MKSDEQVQLLQQLAATISGDSLSDISSGRMGARAYQKPNARYVQVGGQHGIAVDIGTGTRVFKASVLSQGDNYAISLGGKIFNSAEFEVGRTLNPVEHAALLMQRSYNVAAGNKSGRAGFWNAFKQETNSLKGYTLQNWEQSADYERSMIVNSRRYVAATRASATGYFARMATETGSLIQEGTNGREMTGLSRIMTPIASLMTRRGTGPSGDYLENPALGLRLENGELVSGMKLDKSPKVMRRAAREMRTTPGDGREIIKMPQVGDGVIYKVAFLKDERVGGGRMIGSSAFLAQVPYGPETEFSRKAGRGQLRNGFQIPGDKGGRQYFHESAPLATFGGKENVSVPRGGWGGTQILNRFMEIGMGRESVNRLVDYLGEAARPIAQAGYGQVLTPDQLTPSVQSHRDTISRMVYERYAAQNKTTIDEARALFSIRGGVGDGVSFGAGIQRIMDKISLKTSVFKGYLNSDPALQRQLDATGADFGMGFGDIKNKMLAGANIARGIFYSKDTQWAGIQRQIAAAANGVDLSDNRAWHGIYSSLSGDIEKVHNATGWVPMMETAQSLVHEFRGRQTMTRPELAMLSTLSPTLSRQVRAEAARRSVASGQISWLAMAGNAGGKKLPTGITVNDTLSWNDSLDSISQQLKAANISETDALTRGGVTLPSITAMRQVIGEGMQRQFLQAIGGGKAQAERFVKMARAQTESEAFIKRSMQSSLVGEFDRYNTFVAKDENEARQLRLGMDQLQADAKAMNMTPDELRAMADRGEVFAASDRYPSLGISGMHQVSYRDDIKSPQVSSAYAVARFGDDDADPIAYSLMMHNPDGKGYQPMSEAQKAFKKQPNDVVQAIQRLASISGQGDKSIAAARQAAVAAGISNPGNIDILNHMRASISGAEQNVYAKDFAENMASNPFEAMAKAKENRIRQSEAVAQRFVEIDAKRGMGIYNMLSPMAEELSSPKERALMKQAYAGTWSNLESIGGNMDDVISQSALGLYQVPLDYGSMNESLKSAYSAYNMTGTFDEAGLVKNLTGKTFRGMLEGTEENGAFVQPETIGALFSSRNRGSDTPQGRRAAAIKRQEEMRQIRDYAQSYQATANDPAARAKLETPEAFISRMGGAQGSIVGQTISSSIALNVMNQDPTGVSQSSLKTAEHVAKNNPMFGRVTTARRRVGTLWNTFKQMVKDTVVGPTLTSALKQVGANPDNMNMERTARMRVNGQVEFEARPTMDDTQKGIVKSMQNALGASADDFVIHPSALGELSGVSPGKFINDKVQTFIGQAIGKVLGLPGNDGLFQIENPYINRGHAYEDEINAKVNANGDFATHGYDLSNFQMNVKGPGGFMFSGKMDRLLPRRGGPRSEIVDTKTTVSEANLMGQVGTDQDPGAYRVQLQTYGAMVRSMAKENPGEMKDRMFDAIMKSHPNADQAQVRQDVDDFVNDASSNNADDVGLSLQWRDDQGKEGVIPINQVTDNVVANWATSAIRNVPRLARQQIGGFLNKARKLLAQSGDPKTAVLPQGQSGSVRFTPRFADNPGAVTKAIEAGELFNAAASAGGGNPGGGGRGNGNGNNGNGNNNGGTPPPSGPSGGNNWQGGGAGKKTDPEILANLVNKYLKDPAAAAQGIDPNDQELMTVGTAGLRTIMNGVAFMRGGMNRSTAATAAGGVMNAAMLLQGDPNLNPNQAGAQQILRGLGAQMHTLGSTKGGNARAAAGGLGQQYQELQARIDEYKNGKRLGIPAGPVMEQSYQVANRTMDRVLGGLKSMADLLDNSNSSLTEFNKAHEETIATLHDSNETIKRLKKTPGYAQNETAKEMVGLMEQATNNTAAYWEKGGDAYLAAQQKFGTTKADDYADNVRTAAFGKGGLFGPDRLMSGFFAYQSLMTARYTFNPVQQRAERFQDAQMMREQLGAPGGFSVGRANLPASRYTKQMADLSYGMNEQGAHMISGASQMLGDFGNIGRSAFGAGVNVMGPAMGAGFIGFSALSALGTMDVKLPGGRVIKPGAGSNPLKFGLAIAGVTALADTAAYVQGASTDRAAQMRGLLQNPSLLADPAARIASSRLKESQNIANATAQGIGSVGFEGGISAMSTVMNTFLQGNPMGAAKMVGRMFFAPTGGKQVSPITGMSPEQYSSMMGGLQGTSPLQSVQGMTGDMRRRGILSLANAPEGLRLRQADQLSEEEMGNIYSMVGSLGMPSGADALVSQFSRLTGEGRDPVKTLDAFSRINQRMGRGLSGADAGREMLLNRYGFKTENEAANFDERLNALGIAGPSSFLEMELAGLGSADQWRNVAQTTATVVTDPMQLARTNIGMQQAKSLAGASIRTNASGRGRFSKLPITPYSEEEQLAIQQDEQLTAPILEQLMTEGMSQGDANALVNKFYGAPSGRFKGPAELSRAQRASQYMTAGAENRAVMRGMTGMGDTGLAQMAGMGFMPIMADAMSGDRFAISKMMESGAAPQLAQVLGGSVMDTTTGLGLGQRSLHGVFGFGNPSAQEVFSQFTNYGAGAAKLSGGKSVWGSNPQMTGFNARVVNAAMDQGIAGLRKLSSQVSYENSIASAGISAASAQLSHDYAVNTTFPMRRMDMEMDKASYYGGTVQTDWMKKHGIPAYNAGRGQKVWAREQLAAQKEDLAAGNNQTMTRLGWQLEDINRERGRSRVQFQWQRDDMAMQRTQTMLGRNFQQYQFSYQMEDMQRQKQYYREDFAFNRQVSNLQYGWQMQDLGEDIKRSSGLQRKQLLKQRDRATEMHNLQQGQEDKEKKRQEEAFQREEEHFKKQMEHWKQMNALEDMQFKTQEERLKVQEDWREEDFNIREARVRQEMEWAGAAHERQMKNFKIREEQLAAEESKMDSITKASEVRYAMDEAFEKRQYELSLASAGLAVKAAEEQLKIQQAVERIQEVEEIRIGKLESWMKNTQWGAMSSAIDKWIELAKGMGVWGGKNDGGGGDNNRGRSGGYDPESGQVGAPEGTTSSGTTDEFGNPYGDIGLTASSDRKGGGGKGLVSAADVVLDKEKVGKVMVRVLPGALSNDARRSRS